MGRYSLTTHSPALNGASVMLRGAAIDLRERHHRKYIEEIQAAHHLKDSLLSAIGVEDCRLLAKAYVSSPVGT